MLREACEAGAELSRLVKEHASSRRASLHLDLSAADASLSLLSATTPAPLGATRPAPPPEALPCVTSVGTSTSGGSSGAAASDVDGAGGAADGGAIAAGLVLVLDRTQPPARALRLRLHGVGVTDAARGAPPPMRTLLGPHLPPNKQSAPPVAAPLLPARLDLEVATSPADGARYAVALSHAAVLARPEVIGTSNPRAHVHTYAHAHAHAIAHAIAYACQVLDALLEWGAATALPAEDTLLYGDDAPAVHHAELPAWVLAGCAPPKLAATAAAAVAKRARQGAAAPWTPHVPPRPPPSTIFAMAAPGDASNVETPRALGAAADGGGESPVWSMTSPLAATSASPPPLLADLPPSRALRHQSITPSAASATSTDLDGAPPHATSSPVGSTSPPPPAASRAAPASLLRLGSRRLALTLELDGCYAVLPPLPASPDGWHGWTLGIGLSAHLAASASASHETVSLSFSPQIDGGLFHGLFGTPEPPRRSPVQLIPSYRRTAGDAAAADARANAADPMRVPPPAVATTLALQGRTALLRPAPQLLRYSARVEEERGGTGGPTQGAAEAVTGGGTTGLRRVLQLELRSLHLSLSPREVRASLRALGHATRGGDTPPSAPADAPSREPSFRRTAVSRKSSRDLALATAAPQDDSGDTTGGRSGGSGVGSGSGSGGGGGAGAVEESQAGGWLRVKQSGLVQTEATGAEEEGEHAAWAALRERLARAVKQRRRRLLMPSRWPRARAARRLEVRTEARVHATGLRLALRADDDAAEAPPLLELQLGEVELGAQVTQIRSHASSAASLSQLWDVDAAAADARLAVRTDYANRGLGVREPLLEPCRLALQLRKLSGDRRTAVGLSAAQIHLNLSHSLLQLQAGLAASLLQPKIDGGGDGGGGRGARDAPLRLCPEADNVSVLVLVLRVKQRPVVCAWRSYGHVQLSLQASLAAGWEALRSLTLYPASDSCIQLCIRLANEEPSHQC